jgi:serine/threonine protein phosphatase 1
MKNRTLVIGDIHGAYRALTQILDRANVTTNDQIIFIGDYVDGWSETFELINFLIEFSKTHTCIFLRGNHDTWCEEWLEGKDINPAWLPNGGESTVKSYTKATMEDKQYHLNFLKVLLNYHVDEQNNLFLHAGFTSPYGPKKEQYPSNLYWDRTLWEMVIAMDRSIDRDSIYFPSRLKLFNQIFIGHTHTMKYNTDLPINRFNVWNIDTAAGFNGKLTILDINTKEYWQSDVVETLYPDENGRHTHYI